MDISKNLDLIFLLIGALIFSRFINYTGDLQFAYVVLFGILAFDGLFYVFVKSLKKTRNRILLFKWAKLRNFVKSETKKINDVMQKNRLKNTSQISQILYKIIEELRMFEDESNMLKTESHLKYSALFSFVLLLFLLYLTPQHSIFFPNTGVSISAVVILLLLFMIYYSVKVFIAWHRINET